MFIKKQLKIILEVSCWLIVIRMVDLKIPDGVSVEFDLDTVKISGPKGGASKRFFHPRLKFEVKDGSFVINSKTKKMLKKDKMFINTFVAHIKNLFKGVIDGYEYRLKICSGHFPMTVSVVGNEVLIKNYLGEKIPRKAKIMEGSKVEINGDEIIVKGLNKEIVGQSAARIEQATRITNRDRRIFQDGCFITVKAGKAMAK